MRGGKEEKKGRGLDGNRGVGGNERKRKRLESRRSE